MPLTDALLLDPYPFHKWVSRRTDGTVGTGTKSDPLKVGTPDQFDKLLGSVQAGTMIHLGPGTFQTRGYYDGGAFSGYGWQAKGAQAGSIKPITPAWRYPGWPLRNVSSHNPSPRVRRRSFPPHRREDGR